MRRFLVLYLAPATLLLKLGHEILFRFFKVLLGLFQLLTDHSLILDQCCHVAGEGIYADLQLVEEIVLVVHR